MTIPVLSQENMNSNSNAEFFAQRVLNKINDKQSFFYSRIVFALIGMFVILYGIIKFINLMDHTCTNPDKTTQ